MPSTSHVRSRWSAIGAAVAVALGAGGIWSAAATLDSGERAVYVPITPCRVMDTRPTETVGPRATPIGAGETHSIQVRGTNGNCTIPPDAVGVVMNVAAVQPSAASFLTVFPADATRPLAANLNWIAGQPPVSNAVTADIAADGRISFYNLAGTVHVTADVVGYYADHTHDDRYAPKRETLQISGANLMVLGDDVASVNGCYGTQTGPVGGTTAGFVPLDVPRGARLLSASVTILDSPSNATPYTVRLIRKTIGLGIGPAVDTVGTAVTGGGQSQQVTSTLLTGGTEIVDANESYSLEIDFGDNQINGVCQATLEIEHPAPG